MEQVSGVTGGDLQIESEDGPYAGYLAVPAAGHGPGVLVLQEWWGLVPQIRHACDRLARSGYVALAPDLYRGEATTDADAAGRLMMDLDVPRAGRDLGAAVEALQRRPETDGARLGCLGFCMGGQLALYAASLRTEIRAVVDCYGIHPRVAVDFGGCRAKILGLFAEHDEFIPAEAVEALAAALDRAGVEHHFIVYEGVPHAFLNEDRADVHDAAAAARAWHDIETFLDAELR